MREFRFELGLCASLEARGALVARQLGIGIHSPGNRIVDVVQVEPGPGFAKRTMITPAPIPDLALRADVGVGRWRPWRSIIPDDTHPDHAQDALERAVEIGFFERDRIDGRTVVRQTARYPADWFNRMIAFENKPSLDAPGNLTRQMHRDVALGLVDAVILVTHSHVTGAHLNRLPDEVGVWTFDPRSGDREIVREPTPLPIDNSGVEILEELPGRTDIQVISPGEKTRGRRRLAERAYGKGWRTYTFPGCTHIEPGRRFGVSGLPFCRWHDRLVDPATECGSACPGYHPTDPPRADLAAARDRTSPWIATPEPTARTQTRITRWTELTGTGRDRG